MIAQSSEPGAVKLVMQKIKSARSITRLLVSLTVGTLLAGCEPPPVDSVQRGFRGTAMVGIYNPRNIERQAEKNVVPEAAPPASPDGPKAGTVYQNVKVLNDLSVGEFTQLMVSMSTWVAPKEGCVYCHNPANFADDSKYTKIVARRMVEMTRHINTQWKSHVAATGVTCYTCHRGNPEPDNTWHATPPHPQNARAVGGDAGQNKAAAIVGLSSLPYDALAPYLDDARDIRTAGTQALPHGNRQSIKQTEGTYGLMMHMSQALGVNCTYCHNSRSFSDWSQSTPQRATAWHGIRMARDVNQNYLASLSNVFPDDHKGVLGDVAKVNCATCHQGAYKPLYGVSLLKSHPELAQANPGSTSATTPVAAAEAAPAAAAPAAAAPAAASAEAAAPAPATNAAPASAATASATAAVDAARELTSASIYFAVGKSELPGTWVGTLGKSVSELKANADTFAVIRGFHSNSGSLEQNQALAKARAFKVRDAMIAAGVAETQIKMEKPNAADDNSDGEDPKARRVEISVRQ